METEQLLLTVEWTIFGMVHLGTYSPDRFWISKIIKVFRKYLHMENPANLPDFDDVVTDTNHFEEIVTMIGG